MNYENIYHEANEAGLLAVDQMTVTPMLVSQHANPLDNNSPTLRSYFVSDGVCGFASVVIRNIKFSNFLKKHGIGRKNYGGGYAISVAAFNQSLQKKEAYADAFGAVLNKHDIAAYTDSRMD